MVGINEISDNVARRVKTTPEEAKRIIYALLDEIVETLRDGKPVNIRGFGMFYVKYRASRRGTNPRTGEIITIPPRKVLMFKPNKKIKFL
jgi:nucleoid DNA-binding protein